MLSARHSYLNVVAIIFLIVFLLFILTVYLKHIACSLFYSSHGGLLYSKWTCSLPSTLDLMVDASSISHEKVIRYVESVRL